MKKLIIAAALAAGIATPAYAAGIATPAYAVPSFLVAEWYANGDHFCKYENGTVLNVGYRVCPLQIRG